jgi:transcriptional regulator with XRE-family HTH domain
METNLAQTDRSTVSRRIGMQLKVAREANYLTQSAVARQLGLSRGGWSMYESGKRMIDIEIVINFCKLCKVDANFILQGDEAQPISPELKSRLRKARKALAAIAGG